MHVSSLPAYAPLDETLYIHTYCILTCRRQIANRNVHLCGSLLQLSDIFESETLYISASEQFTMPSVTTDTDKFDFYYATPFTLNAELSDSKPLSGSNFIRVQLFQSAQIHH